MYMKWTRSQTYWRKGVLYHKWLRKPRYVFKLNEIVFVKSNFSNLNRPGEPLDDLDRRVRVMKVTKHRVYIRTRWNIKTWRAKHNLILNRTRGKWRNKNGKTVYYYPR